MKQLETKDDLNVLSLLNFYLDIGVDLIIEENNRLFNKHDSKSEIKKVNKEINDLITDEENKTNKTSSKLKNISELLNLFQSYDGCSLKRTATNFIKFEGNHKSDILIMNGTPDTAEDRQGKLFVSEKGILFEKMLNSINLNKEDVFLATSIPWRPPGNRYPTNDEIKTCRPFIFNLIKILKPKIILCLGEIATNQILDLNKSIINTRGKWYPLKSSSVINLTGTEIEVSVLPTFSVSYLLERPDMKKYAWEDFKLLRDKIREIAEN